MLKKAIGICMALLLMLSAVCPALGENAAQAEKSPWANPAAFQEGQEIFARFYELQKMSGVQGMQPYQAEAAPEESQQLYYAPVSGLGISGIPVEGFEDQLCYIFGAASNESFEEVILWNMMRLFLLAAEPETMTELVALELVQEMLFSMENTTETVEMSTARYGRWRMTLVLMEGAGDGPTLLLAPVAEVQYEPHNGSQLRISNFYNRFEQIAINQGFPLALDAETQVVSEGGEDVQLVWELMEGVWWMDMYYGNTYLGSGLNIAEDSSEYEYADALWSCLLIASNPGIASVEELDGLHQKLEDAYQAYLKDGKSDPSVPDGNYVLQRAGAESQQALLVLSP